MRFASVQLGLACMCDLSCVLPSPEFMDATALFVDRYRGQAAELARGQPGLEQMVARMEAGAGVEPSRFLQVGWCWDLGGQGVGGKPCSLLTGWRGEVRLEAGLCLCGAVG